MSFFYDGRLPVYVWGGAPDESAMLFSTWDSSDVYAANPGFNVSTPQYRGVPLAEHGARKAIRRKWPFGSSASTAAEVIFEEPPCDKQFPWRKIEASASLDTVVGQTIHGELYACIGNVGGVIKLDDLLAARWYRSDDNTNMPIGTGPGLNLNPAAKDYAPYRSTTPGKAMPRFRRLVLSGVTEGIKDFAVASSASDFAGNAPNTMTVVTKSGRVYVTGRLTNGAHGVPPVTIREDASLISFQAPYENWLPFYVPKQPSVASIATEVVLPGGVKAASVPSGSSNCVIGDDHQLYYWWWDDKEKVMHAPKAFTGFVKQVRVISGGSGYRMKASGGSPEQTTFAWPLAIPPPPGGRAATAVCQVVDGVVTHVSVGDVGQGYASPPAAVLADQDKPELNLGGQGAAFSCDLFGSGDGFSHTTSAGRGFLLGTDGSLYLLALCGPIDSFHESGAPSNFLSPVKWHSSGPYKFARGNVGVPGVGNACVVGSDGTLYVMTSAIRGADGSLSQAVIGDICVDVDPSGEVQSPNFRRFRFGVDTTLYESHVLLPAGSGYACAETSSVRLSGFTNVAGIVAVKEDGRLMTAGANGLGIFGDESPLTASRKTLQHVATQASWVDVVVAVTIGGLACYAIRKDAVCRSIDQPMEYYPDDYYKTLQ